MSKWVQEIIKIITSLRQKRSHCCYMSVNLTYQTTAEKTLKYMYMISRKHLKMRMYDINYV